MLKRDLIMAQQSDSSDTYFSSYEDLTIHELMLKDKPRTEAYKKFIEANAAAIKGKIVLDVGAGTGILSLLAAKAGAKKVYAVEASGLAGLCQQVVDVNGYSDVIEVIHARVEDATLPVEQVDIIVSEWMGFYLLHEAMLSSVIAARDKWLAPDGILVPSSATIYMCPVNLKTYVHDEIQFWDNAYGFDFSPMKELVEQKHRTQPSVMKLESSQCLAQPQQVAQIELKYVEAEEVANIRRKLDFVVNKHCICHGFACWFTCNFDVDSGFSSSNTSDSQSNSLVVLDTSPHAPATHWQQTVILLPDALMLRKDETIGCSLALQQDSANQRHYNISIEVDEGEEEDEKEEEGAEDISVQPQHSDQTALESAQIANLIAEAMNK